MKTIAYLLASLILAIWVLAIAIFSVQNATLVSLKFLGFESIQLPVGVVLAFCAGAGVVGGAIAFPLLSGSARLQGDKNRSDDDFEDDDFEEDNQPVSNQPTPNQTTPNQVSSDDDWLESGSKDW
ncbi:LapA family protein [Argonema antarcticum]|uniref:LapA family protein n=1 Tax=Argonema antarcticum TaxID=2942763 RepID=UPI0030843ABB